MFLSNRGSFRPETSGAYTLRRRGRRRPKSGSAIGACAVARLAGSGGPIGDYYGSANKSSTCSSGVSIGLRFRASWAPSFRPHAIYVLSVFSILPFYPPRHRLGTVRSRKRNIDATAGTRPRHQASRLRLGPRSPLARTFARRRPGRKGRENFSGETRTRPRPPENSSPGGFRSPPLRSGRRRAGHVPQGEPEGGEPTRLKEV